MCISNAVFRQIAMCLSFHSPLFIYYFTDINRKIQETMSQSELSE